MTSEIFFFEKNKYYLILPFLFVDLLPNCNNESSQWRCNEHIVRAKVWLYGFKSVFWQIYWVFAGCVFVVRFVTSSKTDYRQFIIPFYISIVHRKPKRYLSWFLLVFITLKVIVFLKKISKSFNYCFCSLSSNCYQALLWTSPISFLLSYKI